MLARKSRRGDAGIFTDAADKWVVLVLSLLVAGIVAMTVAMWLRRKDIRVRAKQLHLVTVQTVASVVWFVGVVVRNGVMYPWLDVCADQHTHVRSTSGARKTASSSCPIATCGGSGLP